jgi:hypothetical protein
MGNSKEIKTSQANSFSAPSTPQPGDVVEESFELPEPNPVTEARHRHEVIWQVFLPVAIGAVLVMLLMLLTISGSNYWVSKGADVALIWLISPQLVVSVIVIVINAAFIYGLFRLMQVLPGYSRLILNYFLAAGVYVSQFSNKVVSPILRTRTISASMRQLARSLRGK